jgi:hypothetical protein
MQLDVFVPGRDFAFEYQVSIVPSPSPFSSFLFIDMIRDSSTTTRLKGPLRTHSFYYKHVMFKNGRRYRKMEKTKLTYT